MQRDKRSSRSSEEGKGRDCELHGAWYFGCMREMFWACLVWMAGFIDCIKILT